MTTQRARIDAALDQWTAEIQRAFLASLAKIHDEARLNQVVAAIESGDVGRVMDAIGFDRAAFHSFEEALRASYVAGGMAAADYLAQSRSLRGVRVRFNPYAAPAAAWLAAHSSDLITRIQQEQVEAVRATLSLAFSDGRSFKSTALDLVGRIGPSGKRTGGLIGLSGPQASTMAWARRALRASDPAGLRDYLGLKTRDRRYDPIVRRAIAGEALKASHADRIGDALANRYLRRRGDVIGKTEALEATNAGQLEAHRQVQEDAGAPIKITRIWRSVKDGKVRHSHADMNGQAVEGHETPFRSPSGALLLFPGDRSKGASAAEVIGCRCWVQSKVELDF